MKITREEFENGTKVTNADPLGLFRQGIRAEATRYVYTRTLRRILCDVLEDVLEGAFEQRAAQFVRLGADEPDRIALSPTAAAACPLAYGAPSASWRNRATRTLLSACVHAAHGSDRRS